MRFPENHFKEFKKVIQRIIDAGNENVSISGYWALKIHGILVQREPADLDIGIYWPTPSQELILKELKAANYQICDEKDDCEQQAYNSTKVESGGLTLDFLTDYENNTPENLMYIKIEGVEIKVQSVLGIVCYKSDYGRVKDLDDLSALKELNFNVIKKDFDITKEDIPF